MNVVIIYYAFFASFVTFQILGAIAINAFSRCIQIFPRFIIVFCQNLLSSM